MKSKAKMKAEREYERSQKELREIVKKYKRLGRWKRLKFDLFVSWLLLGQTVKNIPIKWIKFQLDLEDDMNKLGMPRQLRWQLTKWFNYRPFPDVTEYFLWKGKKIWHYSFMEKYNYELHMRYKNKMAGNLWLHPKKDGTAMIIGIHISEEFRNKGLGTSMFQEAAKDLKGRVTSITGVLKKKYDPKPESSIRWLRRQGFEIKEKRNGDYELELRLR